MRRIAPLLLLVPLALVCACSSIDCQLNSAVYCKYALAGTASPLTDTLSISVLREGRTDTTLLNRAVNTTDFIIPMSYNQPTDVLLFTVTDTLAVSVTDTIHINKLDHPHFESVDCMPTYNHTLTSVTWTTHVIDSIIITKSYVSYDSTGENIRIYLKSRD